MWEKLKKIFAIIGAIFSGIAAIFIFSKNRSKTEIKKDREIEELTLQNKSADDIVNDSNNKAAVDSGIEQSKEEFRTRVRDKLKQKL